MTRRSQQQEAEKEAERAQDLAERTRAVAAEEAERAQHERAQAARARARCLELIAARGYDAEASAISVDQAMVRPATARDHNDNVIVIVHAGAATLVVSRPRAPRRRKVCRC